METHQEHLKLRSGNFSIEKQQHENVGLTERFVSVFAGAILLSKGLRNPFKPKFLYGAYLTYRGFTGRCLFYEQLDIDGTKPQAVNIRGEFVIDRHAAEVYAYWRNLNNLPGSVNHLFDVKMLSEKVSHWKSKVLGNILPVDWTAEIVKDEPGRLIGWRSAKGSVLQHVGKVEFEQIPDGMGTNLKIVLSYHPPVGGVGIGLARLFNPYFEQLLSKEIKTFKHEIESPARY
ncbi:Uncharacterized membrane protein [Pedobacter westerhofensis]|uniref:Uncharacterized membrane protein n=1 Tax=Pedobacter westerhofensis TaxID=425512 RepID=A0A521EUD6_9SPHI|nr:YgaP-like transmembrane domain [Pedobacter westerhofensis]SMO87515.1 Uncharacterized membrane protein [Pedobacter westerhofensis]